MRAPHRTPWRRVFDPSRDFVARRAIPQMPGGPVAVGDPIDKTLFPLRRLRQLYDQRTIIYAGEVPGALLTGTVEAEAAAPAIVDEFPERTAVEIPANWATINWFKRKALAVKLTDLAVVNAADAAAAITVELERRGQLS